MADGQSMTVADVVAKTMDGRLEDFVREAVALVARELMEGEISAEVGAGLGEIAPETRLRIAMGIARGRGRRGLGRSSCSSRRSVPGPRTFRRSWSRAGARSRRSCRSCSRRT